MSETRILGIPVPPELAAQPYWVRRDLRQVLGVTEQTVKKYWRIYEAAMRDSAVRAGIKPLPVLAFPHPDGWYDGGIYGCRPQWRPATIIAWAVLTDIMDADGPKARKSGGRPPGVPNSPDSPRTIAHRARQRSAASATIARLERLDDAA